MRLLKLMKTTLATSVALLLAGSVLALTMPPVPRLHPVLRSPKDQGNQPVRLYWPAPAPKTAPRAFRAAPGPLPLYFLNSGNTGPVVTAVDTNNSMVLIYPTGAPVLYVPNVTQAPFVMFQSSPTVLGPWTTVCYFTNFVNGFNLVDVTATNKPMYFYRLVPQ
jgi:hypothetical protein